MLHFTVDGGHIDGELSDESTHNVIDPVVDGPRNAIFLSIQALHQLWGPHNRVVKPPCTLTIH